MTTAIKDRLPRLTKLFYGVSDFGFACTDTTMQVLFAIFITDVVGLKPAYAALAVFIGRTWDYINDPLIGFYTDLYCVILEAMADAGLPAAIYSDDLAYRSGPMLNPRSLEEFFGDGHRRLTATAHALGIEIVIHSCGNVYDLIGWFADNGFDGVHALEPTAGVELARAREIAAGRI